jgi:hypothetical protein
MSSARLVHYTHSSQAAQTTIPRPPPIPVDFDENPDVLATKSAISILQMQKRNAERDIVTLQQIKDKALTDPEGFVKALEGVRSAGDMLFNPTGNGVRKGEEEGEKWPEIPIPQNVVRAPPVNWAKYQVVGDSLEKLHKDQLARPSEDTPQRVGADGVLVSGGEGYRRPADLGVAAPYQPGRDKIEKGTKKSGKR